VSGANATPGAEDHQNRPLGSLLVHSGKFWVWAVPVAAGLAIRLTLLDSGGTHDVPYDVAWGHAANQAGFARYYYGNYFPLQYHTFQLASGLAGTWGISGTTFLKLIDLLFDAGLFVVLVLLARRLGLDRRLALVYWLAPYTLAMDWLGYVDFEMAFFAVLGLFLLADGGNTARTIMAGFAFGAALMTKPQALTLALMFVGLVFFGSLWSQRRRKLLRNAALLGVGPLTLFVGYSAWLASAGRGVTYLARTLVEFGKFQGSTFSENITNLWLVFAEAYRHDSQPIYSVSGPEYNLFQALAIALTGTLLVAAVVIVARRIDERPLSESLIAVFAAGTLTLPMTMTRAHENHLFLGVVFGLIAGTLFTGRVFRIALHTIVLLQFVALVSLYHFGNTGPYWPFLWRAGAYFIDHLWGAAGAVTFVAFCVAYVSLLGSVLRVGTLAQAKLAITGRHATHSLLRE
jgi:hypothetical protein